MKMKEIIVDELDQGSYFVSCWFFSESKITKKIATLSMESCDNKNVITEWTIDPFKGLYFPVTITSSKNNLSRARFEYDGRYNVELGFAFPYWQLELVK